MLQLLALLATCTLAIHGHLSERRTFELRELIERLEANRLVYVVRPERNAEKRPV